MTKLTDASEMPDGVTLTETPRDQHGDAIASGAFYLIRQKPFVDEDGVLLDDLHGSRRVYVQEDSNGDFWLTAERGESWQRVDSLAPRTHWWRISDDD